MYLHSSSRKLSALFRRCSQPRPPRVLYDVSVCVFSSCSPVWLYIRKMGTGIWVLSRTPKLDVDLGFSSRGTPFRNRRKGTSRVHCKRFSWLSSEVGLRTDFSQIPNTKEDPREFSLGESYPLVGLVTSIVPHSRQHQVLQGPRSGRQDLKEKQSWL